MVFLDVQVVPELSSIANLDLKVAFNLDSSRVGPEEWIELAKLLDANRRQYDAFLVVHGEREASSTSSDPPQLAKANSWSCSGNMGWTCCLLGAAGTDTLTYSAAALSFMLAGFKKPIVLTGGGILVGNPTILWVFC